MSDRKEGDLEDPKNVDGPVMPFCVHDFLVSYPKLFMVHHALETPFQVFNMAGTLLGGVFYGVFRRPATFPSALAMMGTSGLVLGCCGSMLGLAKLCSIVAQGENNAPIPWNDDGIQQRVDGIRHNFKVRVLDTSSWGGIVLGGAALAVAAGGPTKLRLSPGLLGVCQALCLGSAFGTMGAFGCIASLHNKGGSSPEK